MQRLKFYLSLFIILSLCSCFSNDANQFSNFVLNHGDQNLLLNLHDSSKVSIAATTGLEKNQTINIEIVSNNKDADKNDIIRISDKKVLLSSYIEESSIEIYSNNSAGNVTLKFYVQGYENNAQYLNITISNIEILVDGDPQNLDSPIYLPDVSASSTTKEPSIIRDIPIEIKSLNHVLDSKQFQVELKLPRNIPSSISSINIVTNDKKTHGDTVAYYLEIRYKGDGIFFDSSVGIEISDIKRKKVIASINKRLVPITVAATQYDDSGNSFISIYDNKGIFLTANEGKVDIPLKIFVHSDNPDGTNDQYRVTATINSQGKEVNFGDTKAQEISFQTPNFSAKMLNLYPVSKAENGIDLTIKVTTLDGEPILNKTIKIFVLKADNQNIIVNSYPPASNNKMLITDQKGVLSFYIPSNQKSYEESTGGISIIDNNLNLSTTIAMSSHKMYYIPYNISTDNGYAINPDDNEAIKFIIGSKTLITSQPLNYIINPIIAYSYIDTNKTMLVQMNSLNYLDFPLLNNSPNNYLGVILAIPKDDKFRARLFKILFNDANTTNKSIGLSIKPELPGAITTNLDPLKSDPNDPSKDLINTNIKALPSGPVNYLATINLDPNGKNIKEKIGINFLNVIDDNDNKISISSDNIVPAINIHKNPSLFLLNQESAVTTVSLDTKSPSLAVNLYFNVNKNTGFQTMIPKECQGDNEGADRFYIRLSKKFPNCKFTISYTPFDVPDSYATMTLSLASTNLNEIGSTLKYKNFNVQICRANITLDGGGEIVPIEVKNKNNVLKKEMSSRIGGFAENKIFNLKGQNFYQFKYYNTCKYNPDNDFDTQLRVSAKLEKHFIGNEANQFLWVAMDDYLLDDDSKNTDRGFFFTQGVTENLISSGLIQCSTDNNCQYSDLNNNLNRELEKSYGNHTQYAPGTSPMGIYYDNLSSTHYAQVATFVGLMFELNHASPTSQPNESWVTIHDLDIKKDSCEKAKTCDYKDIVS